ncbi:MAG: NADH-quinone oxidoreductase subunit NuoG [Magnetococcales bacterium]|nr:NADH-quinone oxidoreductase subunit NuoG [Magnetococcales bacterium]NGZ05998.1 NADH-quinone oxidoreductase subunit NuoG [Magnetococcales bacterium]
MATVIIDGKEIDVKAGTTIMEAAKLLDIYIPHFCYHPKLPIAGNCRMCLVEVEKMPKPVISCAMPVNDGMVVKTDSEMVRTARKGVMEFLLINHPLDCPVCDQGGECSLQDLAMKYGPDRSRFHDHKRHVPNYDLGPIIETEMNRCIHCTRCIRFSEDVSGVEQMGAVYRGDHMQVGPFVESRLDSELTGNLAELCPVGALNFKPFHFQARGWELKHADGICSHCSVGCHTRMDHLDGRILRVMSRSWNEGNETWLCDKGRFALDGLANERLTAPMVRASQGGELKKVSWPEALDQAAKILKSVKPEEVAGLASDAVQGGEELFAFQDLMRNVLGSGHIDHRLRQRDFSADELPLTRADLLMNTPLASLNGADAIVLVGFDPRFETPILNIRLRRATQAGARVVSVGARKLNTNLLNVTEVVVAPGGEVARLNAALQALDHDEACAEDPVAALLKGAKKPVLLLGEGANVHPEAEALRRVSVALLDKVGGIGPNWNGYNRVAARANAAAAQDLGVVPHRGAGYTRLERMGMNASQILEAAASGQVKVLFLLGVDPLDEALDRDLARRALSKARVIYLGAFYGSAAQKAEVVLAGLAPGERPMTLTNGEGRVQRSARAVNGPLEAKEDWRILRALSDRFAAPLGYNDLEALRKKMAASDHRYDLSRLGPGESAMACDHSPVTRGLPVTVSAAAESGAAMQLLMVSSFYRDDPVAARSKVMGQLARDGRLRIHPDDASGLAIVQDGLVRVLSGERKIEVRADLDRRVPHGVVIGDLGRGENATRELGDYSNGYPRVSLVALPG